MKPAAFGWPHLGGGMLTDSGGLQEATRCQNSCSLDRLCEPQTGDDSVEPGWLFLKQQVLHLQARKHGAGLVLVAHKLHAESYRMGRCQQVA